MLIYDMFHNEIENLFEKWETSSVWIQITCYNFKNIRSSNKLIQIKLL